jgi:THO complex subunit 3
MNVDDSGSGALEELRKGFAMGQSRKDVAGHKKKVTGIAWSGSGRRLASGSMDGTARTWTLLPDGSMLMRDADLKLPGGTGGERSVEAVCWDTSSGGGDAVVAAASSDKMLAVYDLRASTAKPTVATVADIGDPLLACWQPECGGSQYIAITDRDDFLRLVDTRVWRAVRSPRFDYMLHDVAWHPRVPGSLWLATDRGEIDVVQAPTLAVTRRMRCSMSALYALRFADQAPLFAVGCADHSYSVWDARECACLRGFAMFRSPIRSLTLSIDGVLVAAGSGDDHIDISHVPTGLVVHREPIPDKCLVSSLSFNPKHPVLAIATDNKDGTISTLICPKTTK